MKNQTDIVNDCEVFIWKTQAPKTVGHVSMRVGSEYISIHPGLFPSFGPLVAFPLPAAISETLTEDMEIEASYQKPMLDPDDPTSIFRAQHTPPKSLAPDYTFKVTNLNVSAMSMFMKNVKKEVSTHKATYQLFPKLNLLNFFKDIPHALTYDPIDFRHTPSLQSTKDGYGTNTYNCATLVTRILQEGGLNIQQSKTPWGQSPNSLAEQLLEHESVQVTLR